jgi:hypothetical protein
MNRDLPQVRTTQFLPVFTRFTALSTSSRLHSRDNSCDLFKLLVRTFVTYPVLHVCDLKAGCKVTFINSYYDYLLRNEGSTRLYNSWLPLNSYRHG